MDKQQYTIKQRRLEHLEQQAARYGIDCPTHIVMEIEDLRAEIAVYDQQAGSTVGISDRTDRTVEPNTNIKPSFSQLLYQVAKKYFLLLVFICAALGAVMGGFLWNVLNVLLRVSFHLGGSGNEPHGFYAFLWGALSVLPVILFAFIACYKYLAPRPSMFVKLCAAIALYGLFGGLGAMFFYDSQIRSMIEARHLGYGAQELYIVTVWSLIISLATSLALLIMSRFLTAVFHMQYLVVHILLPIICAILAVLVSLFVSLSEDQVAQLRGFFAAVALRLGLFLGIVLSIALKST